jgi:hypothetical protein
VHEHIVVQHRCPHQTLPRRVHGLPTTQWSPGTGLTLRSGWEPTVPVCTGRLTGRATSMPFTEVLTGVQRTTTDNATAPSTNTVPCFRRWRPGPELALGAGSRLLSLSGPGVPSGRRRRPEGPGPGPSDRLRVCYPAESRLSTQHGDHWWLQPMSGGGDLGSAHPPPEAIPVQAPVVMSPSISSTRTSSYGSSDATTVVRL